MNTFVKHKERKKMNEEVRQKIACTRETTVLHGEIDFNVKLRLDFPHYENLKHAFTVEELVETVQNALQDKVADLMFEHHKMSHYAVNWTEVNVSSIETKGILEAVLESFVPSRPQMGVEE